MCGRGAIVHVLAAPLVMYECMYVCVWRKACCGHVQQEGCRWGCACVVHVVCVRAHVVLALPECVYSDLCCMCQ